MALSHRIGGTISFAVNGETYSIAGHFKYNLGKPKRVAKHGPGGFRGWIEEPQPAFIEGEMQDHGGLDLAALVTLTDGTVTLKLANGKTIALHDAVFSGSGDTETAEGKINGRFDGSSAEEL